MIKVAGASGIDSCQICLDLLLKMVWPVEYGARRFNTIPKKLINIQNCRARIWQPSSAKKNSLMAQLGMQLFQKIKSENNNCREIIKEDLNK